jgi:low affinity Fe/Cu permease
MRSLVLACMHRSTAASMQRILPPARGLLTSRCPDLFRYSAFQHIGQQARRGAPMSTPKTDSPSRDPYRNVPDSSLPAYSNRHPLTRAFDSFASVVTRWTGSPIAFSIAVIIIAAWAVLGPIFKYSDAWQLVINTGTTIVTFLMVFLIQQSQNKDSVAVHLKLNELMAANQRANSELIGIEDVCEEDLRRIATAYLALSKNAGLKGEERSEVEREINEAKERPVGKNKQ